MLIVAFCFAFLFVGSFVTLIWGLAEEKLFPVLSGFAMIILVTVIVVNF